MQIFRDDSRRRWRLLQGLFLLAILAFVALAFAFVRTLRPRGAAASSATASMDSMDLDHLDAVRARAMRAGEMAVRPAVEIPIGLVTVSGQGQRDRAGEEHQRFVRIGFVDATEEEAIRSVDVHGAALTHVAIEGLHIRDSKGGIVGQLPDDAIAASRRHGRKMLEVVDDVRDDAPHPEDVTAMGRDRAVAKRFATLLDAKLRADGADGVVLALGEDDADPDGALRAVVVEEVAARLNGVEGADATHDDRDATGMAGTAGTAGPGGARGIADARPRRVVAARFDGRFSPRALAHQGKIADLVVVRGFAGLDPKSEPTPLAPRAWLEGTVDAALKLVPASKLVIALATRAGAWPVTATTLAPAGAARELQWADVIARCRAAELRPVWDNRLGNLVVALPGHSGISASGYVRAYPGDDGKGAMVAWMVDGATFADGVALLRSRGLEGIGLASLGGEDPRVWRVLEAPRGDREAMRGALTPLPHPTEPDVIGEGVAMRVDPTQHEGTASVDFGIGGRIESETYDVLPAAPTVVRRGKVGTKTVVLTFDDGPSPEFTPPILDALRAAGVRATFFVLGSSVEREPELLKRVASEGHEIGNHSMSHPDLGKISPFSADLEINSANRLIEATTGRSTVLFRPPYRSDDRPTVPEDLAAIENGQRNGMLTVTSTIDPHDWARPAPAVIVDYLVRRLDKLDGGVVLLHDGGGDRRNTVAALPMLIRELRGKGYRFAQLHDVFGAGSLAVVNPPIATRRALEVSVGHLVWSAGTWLLRGLTALAVAALLVGLFRFTALTFGALIDLATSARERRAIRRTSRLPTHAQVSVVIPAYNEARVIERTILSVLASRGVAVEVLIMDDGSTDDTADVVSRGFYFEPRVRLISLQNGGKAHALNEGFKHARHEIVVALDADTIFLPDTIVELARKFDDDRVGAVAGRAAVGNISHFIARWQALEYVVGQAIERRAWHVLGVVSVVPGAVGAWRRDAVLGVGGFGVDTLAEDTDLTIDLQVAGWRVEYASDAVALTEAPETVRALLKQRFRWCFGVLQTVWKHRSALVHPVKGARNKVVGLILLPAILLTHLAMPLLAPFADFAALVAIGLGHGRAVIPYAVALFTVELVLTVVAVRIDRARYSLMWDWVINRLVYRWILFVALARAVAAALRGGAVGWGKLVRTGTVEAPSGGPPSFTRRDIKPGAKVPA